MEALLVVGVGGCRGVGTPPDYGINAIVSVCFTTCVCVCYVWHTCLIDIACSDSNRLEN